MNKIWHKFWSRAPGLSGKYEWITIDPLSKEFFGDLFLVLVQVSV